MNYFEEMKEYPIAFCNMVISEVVQLTDPDDANKKWQMWKYEARLGFLKWSKIFQSKKSAELDRQKMLEAIEQCKQLQLGPKSKKN